MLEEALATSLTPVSASVREMSERVLQSAIATGHEFDVVECDPELADTAAFCEHYGYSLAESANAIVVVGKSDPPQFACCVLLATTRLNVNSTVRKRLGARKASFADAAQTKEMTEMEIGGVTPFALPDDLPLWIDSQVMAVERVIVGGGSRDRKLLVAPAALAALPNAIVVEGLATTPEG